MRNRHLERVLDAVALVYGVKKVDLLKGRSRDLVKVRQLAIYIYRETSNRSFPSIGRDFDLDHSTIQYACSRTRERLRQDTSFARDRRAILAHLDGSLGTNLHLAKVLLTDALNGKMGKEWEEDCTDLLRQLDLLLEAHGTASSPDHE